MLLTLRNLFLVKQNNVFHDFPDNVCFTSCVLCRRLLMGYFATQAVSLGHREVTGYWLLEAHAWFFYIHVLGRLATSIVLP